MKTYPSTIEPLEPRIAPASVVHLTDANGDIITFISSLGNLTGLVTSSGPLPDGHHDQFNVNLTSSTFNGTNFSVTVTKGPHGDGHLANLIINAGSNNLGNVSIGGDLGYITVGGGTIVPAIKSLTVNSVGAFEGELGLSSAEASSISGSVGKLAIKGDMDGTFFDVTQNIGSIAIGGSLIGRDGNLADDGDIFAGAAIGNVSVQHDVRGGDASYDGIIASTTTLGTVTIGGSVYGGGGEYSGTVGGGTNVTRVAVGGSVIGGMGESSGVIYGGYHGNGTVGKVTIGGSVAGGDGIYSGLVGYLYDGTSNVSLTTVVIGKDIIGGGATYSGGVWSDGGSIGSLTVKGSLIGGTYSFSSNSGFIESSLQVGLISIGGSLYGEDAVGSGSIIAQAGITTLDIGGSIYGGGGNSDGEVDCTGTIGVLNIHGSVIGGSGNGSGSVLAAKVTTETIGGVVVPGTAISSGYVPPA